jgi:hypothetical protein
VQVGSGVVGGTTRASLWTATAASWVDLHSFLSGFSSSQARDVWRDGATVYVVGYGFNSATSRIEALMWVGTVGTSCYPNCDLSTGSPLLTANDFQCFADKFAANDTYANCDGSTGTPALTANDFQCFANAYASGCS